jgi:predicted N-acetyltransferase YhbS
LSAIIRLIVTNKFPFRKATPADAEAIARLVNVAFRPERFFIDQERTNVEKVRALLKQGEFLVTEEGGRLVGCVYVEVRGERGYLGLLAVDPDRQKAGMGSALIRAAEQHCHAAGCRLMELTIVNLRKELPAFYRLHGYSESGTEPFSEAQQAKVPCHLIRMTKQLL